MVKIKLTRDETRALQKNFLSYMVIAARYRVTEARHCQTIIVDVGQNRADLYAILVEYSLLVRIKEVIDKRLFGFANRFTFSFQDHEAITLLQKLLAMPIDSDLVWLINLRSYITNVIYSQIIPTGAIPLK